ncbi:androgen-induced gene 1 protein isoform X3 [Pteropus medius]|uniref:androgen-induced gene 1 protein isoform X3 n=1 Tax=Pteropus vampyrus TaxID=132908 RepID=UPI00196AE86A|nr:androgen-induced gene 1 protein isoform X3 [Pteropus giganteus]
MALVPCQVLRVAILLSYCSILCNYKAIEMPSHQTYGGSWKFLTFINLVIQAVFFGICVLTDLSSLLTRGSGNQEQERQLKKLISLRDWMLAVLAFPVGFFVVAVFWIIYAYDREMIYPKLLDNFIPGWLNHGMDPWKMWMCVWSSTPWQENPSTLPVNTATSNSIQGSHGASAALQSRKKEKQGPLCLFILERRRPTSGVTPRRKQEVWQSFA